MKMKKIYVVIIPSQNLAFVIYDKNKIKQIIRELEAEKLSYYIKEKFLNKWFVEN